MGTREIRQAPYHSGVGPNKPAKQGGSDGLSEVGLADSTWR